MCMYIGKTLHVYVSKYVFAIEMYQWCTMDIKIHFVLKKLELLLVVGTDTLKGPLGHYV